MGQLSPLRLGQIVFGSKIKQFSSLSQAARTGWGCTSLIQLTHLA
jgi:hypothetical protein